MSLIGAGIGAGIGALIGGPIGAALGGWLGHSVSEAYQQVKAQHGPIIMNRAEAQSVFFVTLFSMLAKMAKADGHVDQSEADLINRLARTQLHMDEEDRKSAATIFKNALNDSYSIFDYAGQYRKVAGSREMCEMVYRMLFAVAFADQTLHPAEDAILQEIPAYLGLDQGYYRLLKEEFQGNEADIDEAYKVLGCDKNASDADIKHAYRSLCKEYHPDTIAAKGLPEGFIHYAEQQMRLINSAYETIKKHRKQQQ